MKMISISTWLSVAALLLTAEVASSAHADDASFRERYEAVRVALARDDDDAAGRAARAMVSETSGALRGATERLASARDLDARRAAFAQLTERAIEAGLARGRVVWRCPMAPGRPRWIQARGERADNPYLGRAMSTCGEIVSTNARGSTTIRSPRLA